MRFNSIRLYSAADHLFRTAMGSERPLFHAMDEECEETWLPWIDVLDAAHEP